MKWWKADTQRVVQAVYAIDRRAFQVIRKGPFLLECAIIVDGDAVPVTGSGPAWLQCTGRAANRAIYTLASQQRLLYTTGDDSG